MQHTKLLFHLQATEKMKCCEYNPKWHIHNTSFLFEKNQENVLRHCHQGGGDNDDNWLSDRWSVFKLAKCLSAPTSTRSILLDDKSNVSTFGENKKSLAPTVANCARRYKTFYASILRTLECFYLTGHSSLEDKARSLP